MRSSVTLPTKVLLLCNMEPKVTEAEYPDAVFSKDKILKHGSLPLSPSQI